MKQGRHEREPLVAQRRHGVRGSGPLAWHCLAGGDADKPAGAAEAGDSSELGADASWGRGRWGVTPSRSGCANPVWVKSGVLH